MVGSFLVWRLFGNHRVHPKDKQTMAAAEKTSNTQCPTGTRRRKVHTARKLLYGQLCIGSLLHLPLGALCPGD